MHHIFSIFSIFYLLTTGLVFGQGSVLLNEKELIAKYGENENFAQANKYALEENLTKAHHFFQKASLGFEKAKQWEFYVLANCNWAATYKTAIQDYPKGIAIAEAAIQKIETQAPQHRKWTAQLYNQMGSIYLSIFKTELALEAYQKQIEILKQHYTSDSNWNFVIAYNGIGRIYRKIGKLEQSLSYFQKALAIVEKLNLSNLEWTIQTQKGLIALYSYNFGEHDKSIKLSKKFLNLASKKYGKNAFELVQFYLAIAETYRAMWEKEQSIEYFKKALFLVEREGVEDHKYQIYFGLGMNYIVLGEPEKTLEYWQKCLGMREFNNLINTNTIYITANIGGIYRQQKNYDKAIDYLDRADSLLQVYDREIGNKNASFHLWRNYHWNYSQIGLALEQPELRKKHLFKLVYDYAIEGASIHNVSSEKDLADVYAKEGNLDSAFFYNQRALTYLCNNFKSLDSSQLPSVNELKDDLEAYPVLAQKIQIQILATKNADNIHQKRRYFEEGLKTMALVDEFHLNNFKKSSLIRSSNDNNFIEQSIWTYKHGLKIAHAYYDQFQEVEAKERGFYYVQKMKSQKLWQSLLKSDAASLGMVNEKILEEELALKNEISLYEKKLLEAQEARDTKLINLYKYDHLFDLNQDLSDLQANLESEHPRYYELKYKQVSETEASLQPLLKEDELLIEYQIFNEALYIFTLSKDQALQFHKVSYEWEKTTQSILALKELLENSAMMRKRSREKFITLSHELYQQFLKPIENQISNKQRLIIIGDGLTNYIPFEVLLQSKDIKPFQELDYLIHNHEISYHYSANLFAKAKRKAKPIQEGIFAFAPVYDDYLEGVELASRTTGETINTGIRAIAADGNFSPLPESANEVQSILDLFKKQKPEAQNTIALRATANESTLKTNLKKSYQFIHIAGHSFANLENPKFSGIACYQEQNIDSTVTEDGTLYTGEIYNIKSKADLVTLSSCESGFGKLEASEGILGLNRAFIYAGTPNVVFSLWKVYDKVSANLMVDFYKNVLEGKDYSNSLRAAKLKLLQNETTASPHFWSPFLLIGR